MAGVKPDSWIRRIAVKRQMIIPFVEEQVSKGVISFGLSSCGYDIRVGDRFKVFTNAYGAIVDPKNFDPKSFVDIQGRTCIIPPNSFVLASSFEYLKIPRNIIVLCIGKSTYARCGIIINVTPLEPEWEGHITIEISNSTPLPVTVYANEGIAQLLFFESDGECEVSYADRKGKYQKQTEITPPKVNPKN